MRLNDKLTQLRNNFVIERYKSEPTITAKDLQELLKSQFGFGMSASTLQKLKIKALGARIINYRPKTPDLQEQDLSLAIIDESPQAEAQVYQELRNNQNAVVDTEGAVICYSE